MFIISLFLYVILFYILYTRFIRFYYKIWFYKSQGVPYPPVLLPFFGTFLYTMRYAMNSKNHPVVDFCEDRYYQGKKIVP